MTNDINTTPGTIVPKNSGLAIVSLICGILGVTFLPLLGSIVAVITAPMAKNEIQESAGELTGEEMAKVGQILGWVGIALSVIGFCCCFVIFIIPMLAAMGILINENIYYYWMAPGLLGILF
ncbi:MAG: DUF4190 domain-containing protein [Chloroflexota bacterium]|nr:DUF4190 domain-containing protein [Chloroflexota bacterium]